MLERNENPLGIGQHLKPAQLRDFCLMKVRNGLQAKDEQIFRGYFKVTKGDDLLKAIDTFNLGSLKSVISLLKEDTDTQNNVRAEFAAILVDFEPRPLANFINNWQPVENLEKGTSAKEDTGKPETKKEDFTQPPTTEPPVPVKKNWPKRAGIIIGIAFLTAMAIVIIYPKKECMQWQNDHYELLDCSTTKEQTGFKGDIKAIDDQKDLRKIELTAHTPSMIAGEPAIWYGKKNDTVEYFNRGGLHPEDDDVELRPLTSYMRLKYHIKCPGKKYVAGP